MLRLNRKWGKQYPEKNRVSKQNLGDNVGSEKAQIEVEEDATLNNTHKWTIKM